MTDQPDPGPFLIRLMKAVAPEKGDELERIIAELGISFRIEHDAERIFFTANAQERVITVGVKCLGRLWANAFAYFCIYTDLADAKVRDVNLREMSLRDSERLKKASDLLKWAANADVQIKLSRRYGISFDDISLPPDLPIPFSESEFASDKHVADELSLMAIGYTLHHERVHIELGHEWCEGFVSIEQEKTADMRAAEWLLDSTGVDEKALLKRQLGIAVGLGWLASLNIYLGPTGGDTHPSGYDRLFQVLDQFVEDDNSVLWAFVSVILGVHLQNQEVEIELDLEREFTSFREVVNYYVDVISRIEE